jgi:RecB family endonuclease NucS
MLKFDKDKKTLAKLSETNFKKENLLECSDLQKAIVGSWDVFRNEIGLSSAVLIGEEVNPDPSTADRLDILAIDAEDSSLIVFELKRRRTNCNCFKQLHMRQWYPARERTNLKRLHMLKRVTNMKN